MQHLKSLTHFKAYKQLESDYTTLIMYQELSESIPINHEKQRSYMREIARLEKRIEENKTILYANEPN